MGFSKRHIYLETQHFLFFQLRENDKRTHLRFRHCKSVSHWFPKWYWTGKELLMSKIASSTKFWFLYLQRYRSSWVRHALPFSSVKMFFFLFVLPRYCLHCRHAEPPESSKVYTWEGDGLDSVGYGDFLEYAIWPDKLVYIQFQTYFSFWT